MLFVLLPARCGSRRVGCLLFLAVFSWAGNCQAAAPSPGRDLVVAFARAEAGRPLRYVALGGSITEAGKGWLGPWLQETFPRSDVAVINAGVGSTGSDLAVFRLGDDVIAHEPDVVAIEFCVNDTPLFDEDAVRFMETLVVRLKGLPRPPAVMIVAAAMENGVNRGRHRAVADHYGLAFLDLQEAVDAHLRATRAPWRSLFNDAVHPSPAGHAFYARALADALRPFVDEAKTFKGGQASAETAAAATAPAPLSPKPLLLDARMIALSRHVADDWETVPWAEGRSAHRFSGVLRSGKPGAVVSLPFDGSWVGVFYPTGPGLLPFLASVDGSPPRQVQASAGGGYRYRLLARDLVEGWHVVRLSVPTFEAAEFPERAVALGYLLVAGETGAIERVATQGAFSAPRLERLYFTPITTARWHIEPVLRLNTGEFFGAALDRAYETASSIAIQPVDLTIVDEDAVVWSRGEAPATAVGVARVRLDQAEAGRRVFRLVSDYQSRVWLNGRLVADFADRKDAGDTALFFDTELVAGWNDLTVAVVSGRDGHRFSLALEH